MCPSIPFKILIFSQDYRFLVTVQKKGIATSAKMYGTFALYVCRDRLEFIGVPGPTGKHCIPYPFIKNVSTGVDCVFFRTGSKCPYGNGFIFCETFEGDKIYNVFKQRSLELKANKASSATQARALPAVPCLHLTSPQVENNSGKSSFKRQKISPPNKDWRNDGE